MANQEKQPASQKEIHAFFNAVANGDLSTISKFDFDDKNLVNTRHHGMTALHIAAQKGDTNMIAFLITKGANIEAQTIYTRETALDIAARSGHKKSVETLLESGAKPELHVQAKTTEIQTIIDERKPVDVNYNPQTIQRTASPKPESNLLSRAAEFIREKFGSEKPHDKDQTPRGPK